MHVLLTYKNFAANRAISHIGLGVTALNVQKTLRDDGFSAEVVPVTNSADLRAHLRSTHASHVVISAPWIPTAELAQLCRDFKDTQFAVTCHSNLGFLQADPNAMRLLREGLELRRTTSNFRMAANCSRLAAWVESAYGTPCLLLPNMYHLDGADPKREPYPGGTLRIGAFGATRALKNLWLAACAAGGERLANLAAVPPDRAAHAPAAATQLHRKLQRGDCRRHCGRRAERGLGGDRLGTASLESARG
jgi:hypothetical protein